MDINTIYKELINTYTEPSKTFKKQRKFSDGLLAVVLGSLVPAVILAIVFLIAGTAVGTLLVGMPLKSLIVGASALAGVVLAITVLIGIPISSIINWLIAGAVLWIIGKIIGGQVEIGDFLARYGYLVGAVLLLAWIPIVNIIVLIYSLYLLYMLYKEGMKLDSTKAAIGVVIAIILAVIINTYVVSIFGTAGLIGLLK